MLTEANLAHYAENGYVIPDFRLPMETIRRSGALMTG